MCISSPIFVTVPCCICCTLSDEAEAVRILQRQLEITTQLILGVVLRQQQMIKARVACREEVAVSSIPADCEPHASQASDWHSITSGTKHQQLLLSRIVVLSQYLPEPSDDLAIHCVSIVIHCAATQCSKVQLITAANQQLQFLRYKQCQRGRRDTQIKSLLECIELSSYGSIQCPVSI